MLFLSYRWGCWTYTSSFRIPLRKAFLRSHCSVAQFFGDEAMGEKIIMSDLYLKTGDNVSC